MLKCRLVKKKVTLRVWVLKFIISHFVWGITFKFSILKAVVFDSLQNDLEQVLRQIGDKDQKIQNLEALLQKSKENISLLEKEREDLYAKIQAGEGETAVLNQLQEKNHTLQEQVSLQVYSVSKIYFYPSKSY